MRFSSYAGGQTDKQTDILITIHYIITQCRQTNCPRGETDASPRPHALDYTAAAGLSLACHYLTFDLGLVLDV